MLYDDLEDAYLQTSLGRLHYRQHAGDGGKAVIFLHGFAGSAKAFVKLVEQLPEDSTFYLPDLLGHGESDAPEIAYTVGVQAQAVREFIAKKQAERSYLFGHSYGAWIAATIAQGSYKGDGIILEDSTGLKDSFDDLARDGRLEEAKMALRKLALQTNPNIRVVDSTVNANYSSGNWLTKESLSAIVKPTLIIHGTEDKLVNVKYAKLLSEYIKGSALETIEGAGHTPHYTHAKQVAELIMRFIGS